ncbi:MAG: methionine adenosyltransferase [Vicinamibacterales bacterium]
MSDRFIFSSESVGEGHPDKVADTISDAVLDACLAVDKFSRVACETFVKSNVVVIGGEITTKAKLDFEKIARTAIREIGYVNDDDVFHADKVFINLLVTQQSPDIAQGVDARKAKGKKTAKQGAGDQGLMFGYASNDTPELMPAPIMFAHRLGRELTKIRKSGAVPWLRPDAKSQVSVIYENGKPVGISNVVISTQHAADVSHAEIEKFCIDNIIRKVLPKRLISDKTEFLINPTGRFVIGGPQGDTGLTGRKIIVDSYGGMGRHGGGAFSGKDPTKVDRSAAYMGRWVAKNIVAAGLADRCELQFAYAIGHPDPVSVHIDTFGTEKVSTARILRAVNRVFSFQPADIIDQLSLRRPIYSQTTNYGHFGKKGLSWEATDKVKALQKAI